METMSTMTTVKTVNNFNSMLLKWCTSNLHKNLNQSNIYSTLLKSILFYKNMIFLWFVSSSFWTDNEWLKSKVLKSWFITSFLVHLISEVALVTLETITTTISMILEKPSDVDDKKQRVTPQWKMLTCITPRVCVSKCRSADDKIKTSLWSLCDSFLGVSGQ